MTRIGVTGHMRLSEATTTLVYRALCDALRDHPADTLHGVTCLAAGADRLFARAVLAAGGRFEAILPAPDYRDAVVEQADRPDFDVLVAHAEDVTYLPFARSGPAAYLAASEELLRRSDLLFAVWDGTITGRVGETGQVVAIAREQDIPVRVLWPDGAVRY